MSNGLSGKIKNSPGLESDSRIFETPFDLIFGWGGITLILNNSLGSLQSKVKTISIFIVPF